MTRDLLGFVVFVLVLSLGLWWHEHGERSRAAWRRALAASTCPSCGNAHGSPQCRCVFFHDEDSEIVFTPEDDE